MADDQVAAVIAEPPSISRQVVDSACRGASEVFVLKNKNNPARTRISVRIIVVVSFFAETPFNISKLGILDARISKENSKAQY